MIGLGWILVAALMGALWVVGYRTRNAGWVDIGWTLGTSGLGVLYAVLGDGAALPRIATAVLAGIWGLRLTGHLWPRLHGAREEEPRYARLRARWRRKTEGKLFLMYQFQAALAVALSLPFYVAATEPSANATPFVVAGIVTWLLGFGGETVADLQLRRFKEDPRNRGRVCEVGLWRYSRHPNYFFEWVLWIGYALIGSGGPATWLAWTAPLLMGVLLVRVTGIPPSEQQSIRTRGDAYREYMTRTSPFLPLPPRKPRNVRTV